MKNEFKKGYKVLEKIAVRKLIPPAEKKVSRAAARRGWRQGWSSISRKLIMESGNGIALEDGGSLSTNE